MKIIIAGGTGFLGQALGQYFINKELEVIVLTRSLNIQNPIKGIQYMQWDAKSFGEWANQIEGADIVINLAGRTVNCRYTKENKQQIFDSRNLSTAIIGKAIAQSKTAPKVWLNSSSATIYRSEKDRPNTEKEGILGTGFSVEVCKQWEENLFRIELPNTRQIALRSSLVLGNSGSVLPAYQDLARKGLAGTQGTGEQFVSWIHIVDYIRAIDYLMEKDIQGVVNICAPNPIQNKDFMRAVRDSVDVRFGIRTYKWMAKLGAWFMGTEAELVLKSRWVIPKRLQESGFQFTYPELNNALKNLEHE